MAPLPPDDRWWSACPLLRQARARPESLGAPEEPFGWRPAFVRRSLGLAVVEACALGRFRTPLDAVGPVAAEAVDRWEQTGWRTFHWEPWLAGLAPGARAVVLAEAVGWASSLWSSLDWSLIDPALLFGGPDDQWTCPAVRTVRLKGRAELRVPLAGPGPGNTPEGRRADGPGVGVRGCPSTAWREELAYLALVASLRSPVPTGPGPGGGHVARRRGRPAVEVDEQALDAAVDRVVECVTAVVEARSSVPA